MLTFTLAPSIRGVLLATSFAVSLLLSACNNDAPTGTLPRSGLGGGPAATSGAPSEGSGDAGRSSQDAPSQPSTVGSETPPTRQPDATPETPTTIPELDITRATPKSTLDPASRAEETITPAPTSAAPTVATETPNHRPIRLSLELSEDQTLTSGPTTAWSTDTPSDVSSYEVAIGASMGATDMLGWMSVGAVSSYRVQDGNDGVRLNLQPNRDYYLSVRALDTVGEELGSASSQGWSIYQPFVFNVSRYPEITRDAADSFWGVRHPDPRYAEFDDRFEAYMFGSAAVDVYKLLGERVFTGSSSLRILQTEQGFPGRGDVTRLGEGDGYSNHANTVANMLYDCEFTERRRSYYRGCQTSSQKYAMTSSELTTRLGEFILTPQNADAFETSIFGDLGAPHVWSMAHTHPTSIQRTGDFASDQVAGLRLGDWVFSEFNIISISPQPGSYAGHENPTLSGNYYNSIVAGKKSYNYTYAAQSSIDNENGPRFKPDIVVSASNLAEASSWSVPTLAAAASSLLGLAHSEPLLSGGYLHAGHESHPSGSRGQGLPLPGVDHRNGRLLQRASFESGTMAMVKLRDDSPRPAIRRWSVQLSKQFRDINFRPLGWRATVRSRRLGYPGTGTRTDGYLCFPSGQRQRCFLVGPDVEQRYPAGHRR